MMAPSSVLDQLTNFADELNTQIPQTLDQLCDLLTSAFEGDVNIYSLTASGEYQAVATCANQESDHHLTFNLLNNYYQITLSVKQAFDDQVYTIIQALLEGWIQRIRSSHSIIANQHLIDDQQRMMESILNTLPEAVMVGLAPDGHLILANHKAEEIWQHPLLNVPMDGYGSFGLFDKEGHPIAPENTGIAIVLRTGEPVLGREIVIKRPDQSQVNIWSNTSPIWRENGELLGAVSVFQDISVWRKEAAERDHAIAMIAHDLKNPLTTIRGSADILQRRAIKEQRDERELKRIEAIISQADRMKDYLSFLVDIGQIDAGMLALNLQPTDVCQIIRSVVNAINISLTKPRITLSVESLPAMMLDPIWIERIIWNLLDNAIKYSPEDSLVKVEVKRIPQAWQCIVQDQGYGIDPLDLERIFARFARSSRVPANISGTGLGLFTVRAIAKAHGGNIQVESDGLDKGSTFILTMPLS